MKTKLNKVVKYLIFSDLVFYSGWGLLSPIFAVFILGSITGGNAFVVGMAAGMNLIMRSILRVPFGVYADKSQKRSYYFMIIGLFISYYANFKPGATIVLVGVLTLVVILFAKNILMKFRFNSVKG